MNWQDFLRQLQTQPIDPNQGDVLLTKLASLPKAPDIYWYPGSGDDLTPLLLDVPNNPTGRRLCRMNDNTDQNPVLLWMNDYSEFYQKYPDDTVLGKKLESCYPEIWQDYNATFTLGHHRERYPVNDEITITLFTVIVQNQDQGEHTRGAEGDEYLVCFSNCVSSKLLKQIFTPFRLRIWTAALIRQGGFSGQTGNGQYFDVPGEIYQAAIQKLIEDRNSRSSDLDPSEAVDLSEVEFWIIDQQGQSDKMPSSVELWHYEYVGGPLPWGWPPTRVYAKPGATYKREDRLVFQTTRWSDRYW